MCSRCWRLRPKGSNLCIGGAPVHKLLVCKNHTPQLVVDRDVSASAAIMAVLLAQLFEGRVPADNAWHKRRRRRRPAGGAA